MDLKTPPLNALRAFDAIVREHSISQAAKALHVTQSAISQQQKILENYLGVPLLIRKGKQLRLTPAGKLYAKHINSMFDNLRLATHALQENHLHEKIITINTEILFAIRWLLPRLSNFQTLHSALECRVSTTTHEIDFELSDVDAGIYCGLGKTSWPHLESTRLMSINIMPLCSPGYLKDRDLTQCVLLTDKEEKISKHYWKQWLKAAQHPALKKAKMLHCENQHTVIEAALNHQGIAIENAQLVQNLVKAGKLITPFEEALKLPEAIYLVYPTEKALKPKLLYLRDWLLDETKNNT